MKKSKKLFLLIASALILLNFAFKVAADVEYIKWHNAGHPPIINGVLAKEENNYFVANINGQTFYVSRDVVEKEKYCEICNENN